MPTSQLEMPALAFSLLSPDDQSRSHAVQAYTLEWNTLAANANRAKATVSIQSDSDFIGLILVRHVTDNTPAIIANPLILVGLKYGERDLFDKDVELDSVSGPASAPFVLPFPFRVTRASLITGYATNQTATVSIARLTIWGFNIYDTPRAARGL